MELAGVAADVANARASANSGSSSSSSRRHRSAVVAAPLDLFGCVGEGAPADAMAQECLLLWVGIARAPVEAWVPRGEGGGRGVRGRKREGVRSETVRRCRAGGLDGPVLKAIFCASDAIRLRLAQSLLQVCSSADAGQDTTVDKDAVVDKDTVGREKCGEDGDDDDDDVVIVYAEDERSPDDDNEACFVRGETTMVGELREHVVRLLLDNTPRPEKTAGEGGCGPKEPSGVGEGALSASGSVPKTLLGIGSGTGSGRPMARRTDCTQLFEVLCPLVGESMKVCVPLWCR